ncbi:MAG TPA: hypothetical protein VJ999_06455 [Candidatus Sulfotelmatobacter sp.]|nr:hypothetical protein [Candidatus Sulfotelmatobacter sp.]
MTAPNTPCTIFCQLSQTGLGSCGTSGSSPDGGGSLVRDSEIWDALIWDAAMKVEVALFLDWLQAILFQSFARGTLEN